jgi:nitrogen fixation/metabolism regulation signal transduction histidine kinase
VAAGDLSPVLPEERSDEIGELTASVNEMVRKLREQKVLEDRLRQAEQFSALGHLAAGIAHEIRNPLNFISLSIDHVRDLVKQGHAARRSSGAARQHEDRDLQTQPEDRELLAVWQAHEAVSSLGVSWGNPRRRGRLDSS